MHITYVRGNLWWKDRRLGDKRVNFLKILRWYYNNIKKKIENVSKFGDWGTIPCEEKEEGINRPFK